MDELDNESIKDLKEELEDYKKQKKQVETLVSMIGGKKGFKRTIFIDRLLIILLLVILILDLLHYFLGFTIVPPLLTIEIGILLISIKVIWIAHKRSESEHFMFWFLSSLESRVNITNTEIKKLRDKVNSSSLSTEEIPKKSQITIE
jgi:hypothetical protein